VKSLINLKLNDLAKTKLTLTLTNPNPKASVYWEIWWCNRVMGKKISISFM